MDLFESAQELTQRARVILRAVNLVELSAAIARKGVASERWRQQIAEELALGRKRIARV